MFRTPLLRLALAAVTALVLASCSAAEQPQGPVVLAASSVQEALEEAAAAWTERGHPAPVLSFAATSALARQIEQGAPADIFLSADAEWMDRLDRAGALRKGTRRDLLGNSLVLIAPRDGVASIDLTDSGAIVRALGDSRLAIADPAAVPAGRYGKAALESLGLWPAAAGRLAPAESVRAALALVESGEAALGIVYASDVRASSKVRMVARFPAESHPPIRYPVAVVAASTHPDAEAFADFLASPAGSAIFAGHGFTAP